MKVNYVFKKDLYKEARGSYSRLLNISCRKCHGFLAIYQKDGSGNLRRLYLDRIFYPLYLVKLQKRKLRDVPLLRCRKCHEILGTPYRYQKEKRKAIRLYQDAITKQIRKIV